jgi:hypothetical protein
MISRLDFLFPAGVPDPSSAQYQQMIAEIGREGRWLERLFLIVALLCLIPVVLFVGGGVWELIRRGRVSSEVLIGVVFLALAGVAFAVSHYLEKPRRPYRLTAGEYSHYKVVEALVTELGKVTQRRPGYDRYRRVRWKSGSPLAREGWSPSFLVSSKPWPGQAVNSPQVRLNDVVYVGLDPSGRLPPLFLGVKSAAR